MKASNKTLIALLSFQVVLTALYHLVPIENFPFDKGDWFVVFHTLFVIPIFVLRNKLGKVVDFSGLFFYGATIAFMLCKTYWPESAVNQYFDVLIFSPLMLVLGVVAAKIFSPKNKTPKTSNT